MAAGVVSLGAIIIAGTGVAQASGMPGNSGSFTLTARSTTPGAGYAPTFTGNGLLGVRVPPAGQGYAGGTVPAQSELAGFYAKPSRGKAPERVQQRANIPTWSTLRFADGGRAFASGTGTTRDYRQSIDLRTGIVTTRALWTAPDGHVTALSYQVLTDRAREHVGLVRLVMRPRWTGTATVTDEIDGTADTKVASGTPVLTRQVGKTWDLAAHQETVTIGALGTGIDATLASRLAPGPGITAPSTAVDRSKRQSVGQRIRFGVVKGRAYTVTKYVGVQDTEDSSATTTTAQQQAGDAATIGWHALLAGNRAAWAKMWQGRIDIAGNPTVATDVNASEFYLWSSTRSDQDWSVSPAGLSSNGYDGHIFWDAETWMYPSLLAQHPELASAMEAYRFDRLPQAVKHARATGARGARFPWESALDGTEQIPPPVSINSEGLYEQHITADIALAQWQYWLATGNRRWLRTRGWPVLSGAAAFWASRATRAAHGGYVIRHVTGPDEENPDVSAEAFTEVGARTTLRDAVAAARAIGRTPPASWTRIADGLRVPVSHGIHPEFSTYRSQLVKQADVTLLQYPWAFPMSRRVAQDDLDFYVPRTDPGGPSMSDAVNSIDSSTLGSPGCASFVYTQRSYQPFIRDVFHQFSETRTGGAFTFMTGIGGFLQEFLYGYSGLRWHSGDVRIAPSLTAQLGTVTLRDLSWRGRRFTIAVGRHATRVTLLAGAPLPLSTPRGRRTVSKGHPLTLATARPDLKATRDAVRCADASASSAAPGAPALAAVDGTAATDWQPVKLPATLSAPVASHRRTISRVTVVWGRAWPPAPKPNVQPPPRPVKTLRSRGYFVQVSTTGHRWRTVAHVRRRRGTTDTLRFAARRVRAVRIRLLRGTGQRSIATSSVPSAPLLPMVQELTVR